MLPEMLPWWIIQQSRAYRSKAKLQRLKARRLKMDIETAEGKRPFVKTGREIQAQAERILGQLAREQEETVREIDQAAARRQMPRETFLTYVGVGLESLEHIDRYPGEVNFQILPNEDAQALRHAVENWVRLERRTRVIQRVARNVVQNEAYRLDYNELVVFGF